MSDPVTNIEIEDVLSSIRRLVAEGDKLRVPMSVQPAAQPPGPIAATDRQAPEAPAQEPLTLDDPVSWPKPDTAAAPPDTSTAPPDDAARADTRAEEPAGQMAAAKFVLTPSLRIDASGAATDTDTDTDTETVAAEPTVLLWDDDAADGDDGPEPTKAAESAPQTEDFFLPDAPDEDSAPTPAATAAPLAAMAAVASGRSRLESTIAELEAAITGQSQDFEPDGSEPVPEMDWVAEEVTASILSARTIHRPSQIEDAEELVDMPDDAPDEDTPRFTARYTAEPGPQSAPSDPMADVAPEDRDSMDGELEETLTAYLEEEEILDEETLRTMVAEIVRQELQGALGERITRNVRKLVRREIYRVMTSQELD